MQRAIKSFTLGIATWMVWHGWSFMDAIWLTKGRHQLGSKFWPWSLWILCGTHTVVTVTASWLLVGMVGENLVKSSMSTSSFPSLAVSIFMKSMARILRGWLARRCGSPAHGPWCTAHSCQCGLWPRWTYQANTHKISTAPRFVCSPGDPSCHEELQWHQAKGRWAEDTMSLQWSICLQ